MSFARNFAAGQQIAKTAMDTYEDARLKRDLGRVADAKPTEMENSYTSQDADELRRLASVKDANGNPYYNLEAAPDGSYGLKTNFEYTGADGQMVQPGGVATTFAPRARATEFMGTRYAPEDLTDDRIAGLRGRAMADVISARDPVKGLQMRQSLKSGEREDQRFAWEQEQQPMKARAAALQLGGLERTEREAQGEEAWNTQFGQMVASYTGSEEQLAKAIPMVNNSSKALTLGQPDPKTGLMPLSVVTADGKGLFLQLPQHEQAQIFAAASSLKTNPQKALAVLSGINKELATVVAKENQLTKFLADGTNDVVQKGAQIENDRGRLRLAEQQRADTRAYQQGSLGLQAARLSAERNPLSMKIRTLEENLGRKLNETEIRALGGLTSEGGGLKFTKTDDGGLFMDSRGVPVGRLDPTMGMVPYGTDPRTDQGVVRTAERAGVRIASAMVGGVPTWVYVDRGGEAHDSLQSALGAAETSPSPTREPSGLTAPPRQIGTIVPPRSAAEMVPRQPMSELELMQLLGR